MRMNVVALLRDPEDLLVPPPNRDVFAVSLEDVIGHVLEPFRAIDLERLTSTDCPRGENQVGITGRVIRVKVSEKSDSHIDDGETLDAQLGRCRDTPHDPWPEVDEVRRPGDDDRCRGTGAFRIWSRRSCAEQYDSSVLRGRLLLRLRETR